METEEIEARLRKANLQLLNAQQKVGLLTAELARKRHEAGEPIIKGRAAGAGAGAAAAAPAPAPKKKKKQAPAEPASSPQKKTKSAPAAAGADFVCAGNVVSGEPCPGITKEPSKARTSHGGKLYDTCKTCKKAITNSKKAERDA